MPVTLQEIAQAAGVSVPTVSRALHGSRPMNEEIKQRVASIAQELGYRPNMVARGLRTERTHLIGIIINGLDGGFTPRIVHGIQGYLQARGYFSVIIDAYQSPANEVEALRNLISHSIEGVLIVESFLEGDEPDFDLDGKPYLFVLRSFGRSRNNWVMIDEDYGTRLAMEHLLALGHRRIAHISGPQHWNPAADRRANYKTELARAGIAYDPQLVSEGDWAQAAGGYAAAQPLLDLPQRPTAIFSANDVLALGALQAIQQRGLRVPEDISLVGYDDHIGATLVHPGLTTVTLPGADMGEAAARLILGLLSGGSLPDQPTKISGKLIVRASSGVPPARP